MTTTPLHHLSKTIEMRWANPENYTGARHAGGKTNHGRKGSACRGQIEPGETWTLAHDKGSGIVRRFWITMSDRGHEMLRGLVLRIYWDGAKKPAVEVPLGDFFCNAHGREFAFNSEWFNNPEGRNWNSIVPMPFRKSFKVTVTNETPKPNPMFWYHIDYTLGDKHDTDTGYFHAYWNREERTTLRRDFVMLPQIKGRGRYLGANIGIITAPQYYGWWGEGEVKIFLDGDKEFPTLCGTGTEDYICTAWGTGSYSLPWYGCQFLTSPHPDREFISMYRLHGPDPVYFQKSCRVEVQQIGFWSGLAGTQRLALYGEEGMTVAGDGSGYYSLDALSKQPPLNLFEREEDWCSTVFFYLDRPSNTLPAIAPYAERVSGLCSEPGDFDFALAAVQRKLAILPSEQDLKNRIRKLPARLCAKIVAAFVSEAAGVKEATAKLKSLRTPENAALVDPALEQVAQSGISKPAYSKKLSAAAAEVSAGADVPIVISQFECSKLFPAVKNIAKVPAPEKNLETKMMPFDTNTELGDVREFHKKQKGLLYIKARVGIPSAGKGSFRYGADGPVKVWINGKEADCQPKATNPAFIEGFSVSVLWKKGSNEILFALDTNHGKAWGVVARAFTGQNKQKPPSNAKSRQAN